MTEPAVAVPTAALDVEEGTRVEVALAWSKDAAGVKHPVIILSLIARSRRMNVALRATDALAVSTHLKKKARKLA